MRKTERLDQILVRLGYVGADDVTRAVERQREQGGRIGQKLIELGVLTEEQLFDGLVEQFRIPTVSVDQASVDRSLLARMPVELLESRLIVPIAWNESLGVLSVAVANPSDEGLVEAVRQAFGARKVRVSLAPESVLSDLIVRLGFGSGDATGTGDVRLVALPELFEPATEEPDTPPPSVDGGVVSRRAAMVTQGAVRRNFLPTVLGPEGIELTVVSESEDLAAAVKAGVDAVLVDDEMEADVREWLSSGAVPSPGCELTVFSSIGAQLLDNPAPYARLAASVRAGAQAVAEYRSIAEGVTPPYTLMATDLESLAHRLGLGRLATDGLHVGLHLLTPVEAGTSIDPFRSFGESIELAHRLRFPWPVDRLLSRCLEFYLGRSEPEARDPSDDGVLLAAQLLALVWFRHNLAHSTPPEEGVPDVEGGPEPDSRSALRSQLRSLAGRFATLEVVETYLDILDERGGGEGQDVARRALLVGGDRLPRALGPALTRVGCDPESVEEASAAQTRAAELSPHAVVLDHQAIGADLEQACRVFRVDRTALLFVATDATDPALVLNLLDLGVDDVFGPPHDFDLIAARIVRSIRAREAVPQPQAPEGHFAANFQALSFLDLTQTLANGMKSVRVDVKGSTGEEGVLYFMNGRPVHAACGPLTGADAVYRVISWEDDGSFAVDDADTFPEPNIAESMESLLMEGVRLLDESRA